MAFSDLDPGDETRRNGDYVAFPHADSDGTALDSVTISRGEPVTYDGASLSAAGATTDDIAGILANYDVYGDTGSEEVGPDATVKVRGEVIADLSAFAPTVGTYLDDNADVFVVEEVDSTNNYYRVQVR